MTDLRQRISNAVAIIDGGLCCSEHGRKLNIVLMCFVQLMALTLKCIKWSFGDNIFNKMFGSVLNVLIKTL